MRVGLLPDSRRTSRRRYAHRLRDQRIPRLENAIADLDEGAYESAKPEFQHFIRKYPDEIDGYWNLTALHENTGELELAITSLEKGVKRCPDAAEAKSYLRSLRATFEIEKKQLVELAALGDALAMESESSRETAYETLDRFSDEGISVKVPLSWSSCPSNPTRS